MSNTKNANTSHFRSFYVNGCYFLCCGSDWLNFKFAIVMHTSEQLKQASSMCELLVYLPNPFETEHSDQNNKNTCHKHFKGEMNSKQIFVFNSKFSSLLGNIP